METIEELKNNMRDWSAENLEREKKGCLLTLRLKAPTAEDKAEARRIVQAIEEIQAERRALLDAKKALEEYEAIERGARIMARALEMREEKAVAANRERGKKEPPHEMNQEYRERIAGFTKGKNIKEIERKVLFLINNESDKAAAQTLREYYNKYVIIKPNGDRIVSFKKWVEAWSNAIGYKLHSTQAYK